MDPFAHGGDIYSHPGVLDFSASLNPAGMPPAARSALARCADACEHYPDPEARALTAALLAYTGAAAGELLATAGATDALTRIAQVLRPRRGLIACPCYAGYEQVLGQVGSAVVRHTLTRQSGFRVDEGIERALTHKIDVCFLASPNNPTGLVIDEDLLERVCARTRALSITLVLDECFCALAGRRHALELMRNNPHLVLVGALTKSHALAGLRVGYVMSADARLLTHLRAAGQPWALSVPAQLAGTASLGDPDYLARSVNAIAQGRSWLTEVLTDLGMRVIPGEANYLLFEGPAGLAEALLAHGILIRDCANFFGLTSGWYRVAVRTPQENRRLAAALREVVA